MATAWWTGFLLLGLLPAAFAIAMGVLVAAVQRAAPLAAPLALVGVVFMLLQVLSADPQAVSANLGDRTAAWLYDRLTEACVAPPRHRPSGRPGADDRSDGGARLRSGHDRSAALSCRWTSSPAVWSTLLAGLASAVVRRGLRLVGRRSARRRLAGHPLAAARERRLARPQHAGGARRPARRRLRLPARRRSAGGKELRLFGLAGWTIDRFVARRTTLHELQYAGHAPAPAPARVSILLVTAANVVGLLVARAAPRPRQPQPGAGGRPSLQSAVGVSAIAFGGLNWALDGAAAPVAAVLRLEPAWPPRRRAAVGRAARPTACRRARSAFATSPSPIRAARRCSTAST